MDTSVNMVLKFLSCETVAMERSASVIISKLCTTLRYQKQRLNALSKSMGQTMANLRGGSVDKQLKDAFQRLAAFGKGRHNETDHLTQSDSLATKREMYLRDWGNFVKDEGIDDKVNQAMTAENMDHFFGKTA